MGKTGTSLAHSKSPKDVRSSSKLLAKVVDMSPLYSSDSDSDTDSQSSGGEEGQEGSSSSGSTAGGNGRPLLHSVTSTLFRAQLPTARLRSSAAQLLEVEEGPSKHGRSAPDHMWAGASTPRTLDESIHPLSWMLNTEQSHELLTRARQQQLQQRQQQQQQQPRRQQQQQQQQQQRQNPVLGLVPMAEGPAQRQQQGPLPQAGSSAGSGPGPPPLQQAGLTDSSDDSDTHGPTAALSQAQPHPPPHSRHPPPLALRGSSNQPGQPSLPLLLPFDAGSPGSNPAPTRSSTCPALPSPSHSPNSSAPAPHLTPAPGVTLSSGLTPYLPDLLHPSLRSGHSPTPPGLPDLLESPTRASGTSLQTWQQDTLQPRPSPTPRGPQQPGPAPAPGSEGGAAMAAGGGGSVHGYRQEGGGGVGGQAGQRGQLARGSGPMSGYMRSHSSPLQASDGVQEAQGNGIAAGVKGAGEVTLHLPLINAASSQPAARQYSSAVGAGSATARTTRSVISRILAATPAGTAQAVSAPAGEAALGLGYERPSVVIPSATAAVGREQDQQRGSSCDQVDIFARASRLADGRQAGRISESGQTTPSIPEEYVSATNQRLRGSLRTSSFSVPKSVTHAGAISQRPNKSVGTFGRGPGSSRFASGTVAGEGGRGSLTGEAEGEAGVVGEEPTLSAPQARAVRHTRMRRGSHVMAEADLSQWLQVKATQAVTEEGTQGAALLGLSSVMPGVTSVIPMQQGSMHGDALSRQSLAQSRAHGAAGELESGIQGGSLQGGLGSMKSSVPAPAPYSSRLYSEAAALAAASGLLGPRPGAGGGLGSSKALIMDLEPTALTSATDEEMSLLFTTKRKGPVRNRSQRDPGWGLRETAKVT